MKGKLKIENVEGYWADNNSDYDSNNDSNYNSNNSNNRNNNSHNNKLFISNLFTISYLCSVISTNLSDLCTLLIFLLSCFMRTITSLLTNSPKYLHIFTITLLSSSIPLSLLPFSIFRSFINSQIIINNTVQPNLYQYNAIPLEPFYFCYFIPFESQSEFCQF